MLITIYTWTRAGKSVVCTLMFGNYSHLTRAGNYLHSVIAIKSVVYIPRGLRVGKSVVYTWTRAVSLSTLDEGC